MRLNIQYSLHAKGKKIANSVIINNFFKELSKNIFKQSYRYWERSKEIVGNNENQIPVIFDERNIYSTIAVAINEITPVHFSEWSFNKEERKNKNDKNRRVDFWCLNKNGNSGKPINYFIEVKKGYCDLNNVESLIEQTESLERISPEPKYGDNAYLGILVIHCSKSEYDEKNIIDNIKVKPKNIQVMSSLWTIPEYMEIQWGDEIRFILIVGFALNGKK